MAVFRFGSRSGDVARMGIVTCRPAMLVDVSDSTPYM